MGTFGFYCTLSHTHILFTLVMDVIDFNADEVCKSLQTCIDTPGLDFKSYLQSCQHLSHLVARLGKVMSILTLEINPRVNSLKKLTKNAESVTEILKNHSKESKSQLVYLNAIFVLIFELFDRMLKDGTKDDDKVSVMAWEAYQACPLYKTDSFIKRGGVKAAVSTLGNVRQVFDLAAPELKHEDRFEYIGKAKELMKEISKEVTKLI